MAAGAELWFRELTAWLLLICAGADLMTVLLQERQELQIISMFCHLLIPLPMAFAGRAKHGKSWKFVQPFEGGGTFIFCSAAAYGLWGIGLVVRSIHLHKTFFFFSHSEMVDSIASTVREHIEYENLPSAFLDVLEQSVPNEFHPFMHSPFARDAAFRFSHALGATLFFIWGLATFQPAKTTSKEERGHKRSSSDPLKDKSQSPKSRRVNKVMTKVATAHHPLSASENWGEKQQKEEPKKEESSFLMVTNNVQLIWKKPHVRGALFCSMVVVLITLYVGYLAYRNKDASSANVTFLFFWEIPLYILSRTTLFMHLFTGVVCHFFFGLAVIPNFEFFEPFVGSKRYIFLQVLGWTLFGDATLFFYTSLNSDAQEAIPADPWRVACILSFLSSFLLILSNCCRFLFWSARKKTLRPPDLARVSVLFNFMVLLNLGLLTISFSGPLSDPESFIQHGVVALAASALIVAPLSQIIIFFVLPLYRSKQKVGSLMGGKNVYKNLHFPPRGKGKQKENGKLSKSKSEKVEELGVGVGVEREPEINGFVFLIGRVVLMSVASLLWVLAVCVFFVAHNTYLMCVVVGILCALVQCLYYPVLRQTSTELVLSSRSTNAQDEGVMGQKAERVNFEEEPQEGDYSSTRVRQVVSALFVDIRTTRNGPFTLSFSLFLHAIIFRWLIPVIFGLQIFGLGNLPSLLPLSLNRPDDFTTVVSWSQRASFGLACCFFSFTASVPMAHLSIRGVSGLWLNPFSGTPLFAAMQASSWIAHMVCFTLQLYMLVGDLFPRDPELTRTFFPAIIGASADAAITQQTVRTLLVAIGNAMLETSAMFLPYALSVASVFAYDSILHEKAEKKEKKKSWLHAASLLGEEDRAILKEVLDSERGSAALHHLCGSIVAHSEGPLDGISPRQKPGKEKKTNMVHPAVLFVVVIALSTLSFLLYLIGEKSLQTSETNTDIALVFVPTFLGFVTCTAGIVFGHALLGPSLHKKGTYVLWMPFRGGTLFMVLQAVGFAAYTASIVQTVFCGAAVVSRSYVEEKATPQSILAISLIPPALLSAVSPLLIAISSLFFIPEPKQTKKSERWMYLSVYDNAEGLICLGILFGGWCIATFNDHLAPSEWASATAPLVLCCIIATICAPLGVISMRKSALLWAEQQRGAQRRADPSGSSVFLVPLLMILDGIVASACFLLPVLVVYGLYLLLYASFIPSFNILPTFEAYSYFFLLAFIALFLTMFARGFFGGVFAFIATSFFYTLPHLPYFTGFIPLFYNNIAGYWMAVDYLFSTFLPPMYIQPLLTVGNAAFLSLASRRLFCLCMCTGGEMVVAAVTNGTTTTTIMTECGWAGFLCNNIPTESIFGNDRAATMEYTFVFGISLLYKLSWVGAPERRGTKFSPKFMGFMRHTLIRGMERYFSLRVFAEESDLTHHGEEEGAVKQNYLFGWHPHGVLAGTCLWGPLSRQWREILPHKVARFGASVVFQIPLLRDLVMGLGGRVVTRDSIIGALRDPTTCAMLVPGGQAEMIESRSSETRCVVKNHHVGFLRIAIQEQVPVVPVFCFGEIDILNNVDLPNVQRFSLRKLGIAFPVSPYGLMGFLPLPRPKPLTIVVGKPISLHLNHPAATFTPPAPSSPSSPGSPPPSPSLPSSSPPPTSLSYRAPIDEDLLKELTEVYFDELTRVFYKYREQAGYPKMDLVLTGKVD